VEDTLDFLENEWPSKIGTHRRQAIDLCEAALNRVTPTEAAREAVIAACIEAKMPLVILTQSNQKDQSGNRRAA
jgi:hypothetical protein